MTTRTIVHSTIKISLGLNLVIGLATGLGTGCETNDGFDGYCQTDYDCLDGMTCEYGECMPTMPSPGPPGSSAGDTCNDGRTECEGSDILVCEDNSWTSLDCGDVCGYYGFESNGCSSDVCQCGDVLDEECSLGVDALCTCAESLGESCTNETASETYTECWQGEAEFIRCFAEHVAGNQIDCAAAFEDCL